MASSRSILDDLGEEVTGIVAPVSICMALTVALVRVLNPSGNSNTNTVYLATAFYQEKAGDSAGTKFGGALMNAVIFVCAVAAMTFLLVLLFKYRCTKLIYGYMGFSGFSIFFVLAGTIGLQLLQTWQIPIDAFSYCFILYNFSMVGVFSLFFWPAPLLLKQGYLIVTGVIVAYIFTFIPEWTTWMLLVMMALYDLCAVLTPHGPLKVLVELAQEREEDIPALVYEARSTNRGAARQHVPPQAQTPEGIVVTRRANENAFSQPHTVVITPAGPRPGWSRDQAAGPVAEAQEDDGGDGSAQAGSSSESQLLGLLGPARTSSSSSSPRTAAEDVPLIQGSESLRPAADEAPLPQNVAPGRSGSQYSSLDQESPNRGGGRRLFGGAVVAPEPAGPSGREGHPEGGRRQTQDGAESEDGWGLPDAIKLGLGDFIFYSVLVGRAAMYDMLTVFAAYAAIIAGLGATLLLLALHRKALPALPISIALGVLFYFLGRLVLEPVVLPVSMNLLYF
ncbi:hypothetical protein WJX72_000710 [[Myrmecia] bisecta]|uniref:Presenilin n=1 Tax=[Myrmecia] bisecta TaxID=41462 RepID=A0AAW1R4N3_9CHLO